LTAALALFSTDGYSVTTLDSIEVATGASTGTVYHYFPTGKTGIGATLQLEGLADYQGGSMAVLDAAPDASSGIADRFATTSPGSTNTVSWPSSCSPIARPTSPAS